MEKSVTTTSIKIFCDFCNNLAENRVASKCSKCDKDVCYQHKLLWSIAVEQFNGTRSAYLVLCSSCSKDLETVLHKSGGIESELVRK